jgi:hypothetical protein
MRRTPRLYANMRSFVCIDVKRLLFFQTASNSTRQFGGFEAPSDLCDRSPLVALWEMDTGANSWTWTVRIVIYKRLTISSKP